MSQGSLYCFQMEQYAAACVITGARKSETHHPVLILKLLLVSLKTLTCLAYEMYLWSADLCALWTTEIS